MLFDTQLADVDGDGLNTVGDAIFVSAHFTKTASARVEQRCDVDGDGDVDRVDMALVWSVDSSLERLAAR